MAEPWLAHGVAGACRTTGTDPSPVGLCGARGSKRPVAWSQAGLRHIGGLVWAEAGLVTLIGIATGAMTGWALSNMLVKVLRGVFDPAPAALAVPWTYLGTVLGVALAATATAALIAIRSARMSNVQMLRET